MQAKLENIRNIGGKSGLSYRYEGLKQEDSLDKGNSQNPFALLANSTSSSSLDTKMVLNESGMNPQ